MKTFAGMDGELEAMRNAVVTQFEDLTGYLWNSRTGYVEIVENTLVDSPNTVWLALSPVTTLTTVEEKARASGATWTALASTAYELIGTRRLTKLSGNFEDLVRVTYTGGYTDLTCPADIANALLAQAKFLASRLDSQKIALSQQAFEAGSTSFLSPDLHPLFAACVRSRRRKF